MKKYFLTGLIILMPLVLTLVLIIFLVDFFTAPVISLINQLVPLLHDKLPFHIPEELILFLARLLALFFICLSICLLGICAPR